MAHSPNILNQGLISRMVWLEHAQRTAARNLAYEAMPGYHAVDIEAFDVKKALAPRNKKNAEDGMTATHSTHFGTSKTHDRTPKFRRLQQKADLTGNTVIREKELVKLNQAKTDFEVAINLYRKNLALVDIVLGKPGGGG